MQKQKFRSIRQKLIIILSLTALFAVLFSSAGTLLSTKQKLEQSAKTSLQNTADILILNLLAPIAFEDVENTTLLLKTLNIDKNILGAFVFDTNCDIFANYVKEKALRENLLNEIMSYYANPTQKDITTRMNEKILTIDSQYIFVSLPVMSENNQLATFCIIYSKDSLQQSLYQQLLLTISLVIITLIIVFFLAQRLQRIFTTPLFRLQASMKEVSKNVNYDIDMEHNYNDEFGHLFNGYQTMLQTIKKQKSNIEQQLDIVKSAEKKQLELVKEVGAQKKFVQTLLDSQEQIIVTTDGKTLVTANETFLDFFAVDDVDEFMNVYDAKCICNTFNVNTPKDYLQIKMGENKRESWIDYVISRSFDHTHKAMISMGSIDFIFSVTATKLPGEDGLKSAVFTNITEMENTKIEIEAINKHTRESIEYAALIQGALIPDNQEFKNYFQDYFAIWHPKDIVGGDIYLFDHLRNRDECLLMVVDCTGHGVPGAFVTMLVKAIERQITAKINYNADEEVSPAKILGIFNQNMKQLLKQESTDSVSNAGFDGGIIYYNKKEKILKFAGAETALYYVEDDEFKTIKGNRYSVGYKKCDMDYEYKEHIIDLKEGMEFYLTTDGYIDQNGGKKGFPFGKRRLKTLIEKFHKESMVDQQEVFLSELDEYQGDEGRNDDVTFIGFRI